MSSRKSQSSGTPVFDTLNVAVMIFVLVVTLYPFLNILAVSLNDANDAVRGNIYLWPRVWTLASYEKVFQSDTLLTAFMVTVARTLTGTFVSVLCCMILAYAMSKRHLIGKTYYYGYFIFSMLFSGGLIPTYLVYKELQLIDTFAVYIVPAIISIGSVLLIIMFFREIPEELEESAKIDGANEWKTLFGIYMPLSLPCLATISLFAAVGHWNAWFDSMIYINNRDLKVLQLILQQIVNNSEISNLDSARASGRFQAVVSPETIKAAITMVTTVPIIMVYPFLQKYFVKGLIIGAVKG